MRPLRLVVQAFGAYAGRQAFDFADLKGRSLFLIAGPTGAGKTTVLDAICFALYGTTSGGERKPDGMRSDHVPPDVATEVTFDFELGEKSYRVRRNLDYQRPAKRGEGTTVEPQNATLWDRTGTFDPADEGRHVVSRWDKVTKEVERLLGFRDDEFRQVVLIPQGRFRDLLLADSRRREEILSTLFRTRRYAAIERALKDAFNDLRRQLEQRTAASGGVLEAEGAKTIEDLEAQALAIEAERDAARQRTTEARQAKAAADAALAEGRRVAGVLAEAGTAREALGAIEARAAVIEALRVEAARGRTAAGLRDAAEDADRRRSDLAERERERAGALALHEAAVAALAVAQGALEARQAAEPEREALGRRAVELEGLAVRVGALAAARDQVAGAQRVATAADARAREAAAAVVARLAEATQGRAAVEETQRQADLREAAALAKRQADADRQQATDLARARREAADAARDHGQACAAHDALARRLEEAGSGLERAERALRDGAAGLLASRLEAGAPCPVCGSTTHPAPASRAEDLPDPAVVTGMRERVRDLAEQAAAAAARVASRQAAVAAAEARVEQLALALGDRAGLASEAFDAACAQADAAVARAEAAHRSIDAMRAAQAGREAAHAAAIGEAEARAGAAARARALSEAALATLAEREGGVPPEFREPSALDRERKAVTARIDALKRALELAANAHAAAATQAASREAAWQAAVRAADEAGKVAAARRTAFLARLSEAGFAGEADYADARRTDAELAALADRIDRHDRDLAAARDRCARAETAAEGAVAPDLPALEGAAATAATVLDAAADRAGRLAQQVEHKRMTLAALQAEALAVADLQRDFGLVATLSGAANGQNPLNLTFQRYVLAALLDSVLAAATARLGQMTSGRFLLRRMDSVGDRRFASGLDLEVMDHYTGHARPVASLSGGESFLAALSLALGLADVVQAYSGGIRLETVFIDEGFGSLDPEALDLALRELTKLHEGGRLVGIISHVPELRQRIDARLEVTPGRDGSRAAFVVG